MVRGMTVIVPTRREPSSTDKSHGNAVQHCQRIYGSPPFHVSPFRLRFRIVM
jgi:hypothetical protein